MAIPTRSIACSASPSSNLVGPLLEYAKDALDDATTNLSLAASSSVPGRRAPTHVGFGIRFELDSSHGYHQPGFESDLKCRLDIHSIDLTSTTTEPEHPTPAVHLEMDLRHYDHECQEDWLVGGPLEPTRLRSIECSTSWNKYGLSANATLNDAAFMNVVDWSSEIPGQLEISSSGSLPGFGECVNAFLTEYSDYQHSIAVHNFLSTLEAIGIASCTAPNPGETLWQVNSSALDVFVTDPRSYLESTFTDANGNWDLSAALSSSSNGLFEILSNRIGWAELVTDPNDSRYGALKIQVQLFNGSLPFSVFLKPDFSIDLVMNSLPIGNSSLSAELNLDLTNQISPGSGDPIDISCAIIFSFGSGAPGPLNGSQLIANYREIDDNGVAIADPFSLNFFLPGFTEVFDLTHTPAPSWVTIPSMVQIYPLPGPSDFGIVDFLVKAAPTIIAESLVQYVVDEHLLSELSDGAIFGEVLEILGLAQQTSTGIYSSTSLMAFAQDPKSFLQARFCHASGLQVPTILSLFEVLFQAIKLDYYTEISDYGTANHRTSAIVVDIAINSASISQLVVMEHPSAPDSITFAIRSPPGDPNPMSFVGGGLEFELLISVGIDLSVSVVGSRVSLIANPHDLLNWSSIPGIIPTDISLEFEVTPTGFGLELEIIMPSGDSATLFLLPQFSGIDSVLQLFLGNMAALLPYALSLLLNKLDDDHGIDLITTATTLGLWDATGDCVDELQFGYLMDNPKGWLFGDSSYIPALSSKLSLVIVTMTKQICSLIDQPTIFDTSDPNYVTITPPLSGTDFDGLELIIGDQSGDVGIWIRLNQDIDVLGTNDLRVNFSAGLIISATNFDNVSLTPEFDLTARISKSSPIISDPIDLCPIVQIQGGGSGFNITLATNYDDSGPSITFIDSGGEGHGFWIQLLPTPIQCGMPNLAALALGLADTALKFIADIVPVQNWLGQPIYNPSNPSTMQTTLSDLTKPGEILQCISVMVDTPPTPYSFRSISDIINDYSTDPLGTLIGGIIGLIESAIDGGLVLYEDKVGDFQFTLSIVDSDPTGNGLFGFNFNIKEAVKTIGKMKLRCYCQEQLELNNWTLDDAVPQKRTSTTPLIPGITIYLVEWLGGANVKPHLSLEIGGLGIELLKDDGDPLLDNFLCLNKVGLVTSLDVNILNAVSVCSSGTCSINNCTCFDVEFGGLMILDDFGIELGGDGESEGGNGMASGLLTGGEDGKDPVKPSFDLYLSCYNGAPLDVSIRDGMAEFWFPINKDFGPLKIDQIGVRYFTENNGIQDEHRLGILVDGSAEVAGFNAQVDDLMVSFPLLDPFDFKGNNGTLGWQFDMAGLAIGYDSDTFSIAGALRKETSYAYFPEGTLDDAYSSADIINVGSSPHFGNDLPNGMLTADALKYAEYQGLCTITTDTLGISAIGAFARVPNADGTGFVSVFVIAALNMPLGGPPFFFVTGLLGGLGLNRQLAIPDIADVPQHLFIQTLGGDLAEDPMGALNLIKSQFPIEHGSFWFAAGLKFTSFQIIESRAVLFIKIDTGFTIGIVALSAMSLPSKELNLGYIELALLAYYSSEEQVLWVQAQLTDASYIFSQSCRLTGGFALVTWFKTGEFVLSLGGYHPNFNAPDYYPVVPRIGFNWSPTSSVTVKGGVYFTLCTSAVMLGGGLDASYKAGKLSAGFRMGLDVLVVFDPFYYEFGMYIELYVKYKTWLKTFKASIGADLQIEGPKMRGTATITLAFISFTVKFGSDNQGQMTAISGTQFLNKHVRQLPEAEADDTPSSEWINTDFMNANVLKGVARPASAKNDDGSDNDSLPTGEYDEINETIDPWLLEPEFDFALGHKFPATEMQFRRSLHDYDALEESTDSMDLGPMFEINQTSRTDINLQKKCESCNNWHVMTTESQGAPPGWCQLYYAHQQGITVSSKESFFPETIWSYTAGTAGKPKAKTSAGEQLKFLSSYVISGRCYLEDGTDPLNLEGKVEPCGMYHYIPLHESSGNPPPSNPFWTGVMEKPLLDFESAISDDDSDEGLMSAIIKLMNDDDVDMVKQTYIKETAKTNTSINLKNYVDISKASKGKSGNSSGAKGSRRKNAKAGGNT